MGTSPGRRRRAWRRGRRAEQVAGLWLMARGYRILARRYRTSVGEIDLVARRGSLVVFVEVKARTGAACDVLTAHQAGRMSRAAQVFLARRRLVGVDRARFDLMVLRPWRFPRHVADAFRSPQELA